MFTGIIEKNGEIVDIEPLKSGFLLQVQSSFNHIELGESIAANGVCLTAKSFQDGLIDFDVSPETLVKTNFNILKTGDILHLEKPLTLAKPIGGHFVTGHVDETLEIENIESVGEFKKYIFKGITHPEWVCEKGSVALEGISLTINQLLGSDRLVCMLIPHTINVTRFNRLKVGDLVNVEYDYLAKIVARQCAIEE